MIKIDFNDFIFDHFHICSNTKQAIVPLTRFIFRFSKRNRFNFSVMDTMFSNELPFFRLRHIELSVIDSEQTHCIVCIHASHILWIGRKYLHCNLCLRCNHIRIKMSEKKTKTVNYKFTKFIFRNIDNIVLPLSFFTVKEVDFARFRSNRKPIAIRRVINAGRKWFFLRIECTQNSEQWRSFLEIPFIKVSIFTANTNKVRIRSAAHCNNWRDNRFHKNSSLFLLIVKFFE